VILQTSFDLVSDHSRNRVDYEVNQWCRQEQKNRLAFWTGFPG